MNIHFFVKFDAHRCKIDIKEIKVINELPENFVKRFILILFYSFCRMLYILHFLNICNCFKCVY